jgi:hypothetical protein
MAITGTENGPSRPLRSGDGCVRSSAILQMMADFYEQETTTVGERGRPEVCAGKGEAGVVQLQLPTLSPRWAGTRVVAEVEECPWDFFEQFRLRLAATANRGLEAPSKRGFRDRRQFQLGLYRRSKGTKLNPPSLSKWPAPIPRRWRCSEELGGRTGRIAASTQWQTRRRDCCVLTRVRWKHCAV